ncbi:MAG: glycosyltransferase family 4 protein [bacterium]|nr:glycosyltransferase family 4 protein [bacterium]
MKICIVSDLYYPYPGGVSEHVYHTSHELMKMGHEVKILTTSYKTYLWRDYETYEIDSRDKQVSPEDVIRLGIAIPYPTNRSVGVIPIGFRLNEKVKKVLNSSGSFDIIHMHGPSPSLPLIALRCSSAINILTFHAHAPDLKLYKYFTYIIQPYIRKIDAAIAVSRVALTTMQRYLSYRQAGIQIPYTIIPNGVDTKRFSPEVDGLEKFRQVSSEAGHNILFIGRFEPRKGLKYLIQAFQIVRQEFHDSKLIVVGKGWLSKIKNQNAKIKNIYFEGFISPEILPRYYTSCDVFCSPAIGMESFGIVLLEAMASGKPVVATNIPGYREVITNGLNGILVEPKNPKSIADAIIGIFKNNELRTRLAKEGREAALRYSWDKVTRKIEQFYYEIAEKKRGGTSNCHCRDRPCRDEAISR